MAQRNNTGPTAVSDNRLVPVGYEQITGISVGNAKGLTAATFSGADFAIIQAEDQNVRWRDDGTSPDATTGMVLAAGSWMVYTGDLSTIEVIEETATAIVNVSYYRAM